MPPNSCFLLSNNVRTVAKVRIDYWAGDVKWGVMKTSKKRVEIFRNAIFFCHLERSGKICWEFEKLHAPWVMMWGCRTPVNYLAIFIFAKIWSHFSVFVLFSLRSKTSMFHVKYSSPHPEVIYQLPLAPLKPQIFYFGKTSISFLVNFCLFWKRCGDIQYRMFHGLFFLTSREWKSNS